MTARTLKDAYRIVRKDYGEDAVILGTRTVNRRQELGLGHDREVEVTVQMPGSPVETPAGTPTTGLNARPVAPAPARAPAAVSDEIEREIARIEELVDVISADHGRLTSLQRPLLTGPLAETLVEQGASPGAVETILTRFTSETGADAGDRPAAITWLTENLRASNCAWEDFYGCHAFLGERGCGRSDLVLTAAARLQGMGRKTLVLSVLPGSNGDVRQLQIEAARGGYDAAVIKKEDQLTELSSHLESYEVVLVDMPHLRHADMAEGAGIHGWLARNPGFHRHLVVPLDRDPRDLGHLREAARAWNCDWIAISRTDMTTRPAKLLDVLEELPVPVSLTTSDPLATGALQIAQSESLLDAMLGAAEQAPDFRPGVETAATAAIGSGA